MFNDDKLPDHLHLHHLQPGTQQHNIITWIKFPILSMTWEENGHNVNKVYWTWIHQDPYIIPWEINENVKNLHPSFV